jgi:hypothetical protein
VLHHNGDEYGIPDLQDFDSNARRFTRVGVTEEVEERAGPPRRPVFGQWVTAVSESRIYQFTNASKFKRMLVL